MGKETGIKWTDIRRPGQVAAFRPTDAMIPADLMIRQWPKGH